VARFRFKLWKWRIAFYFSRVEEVKGVNSQTKSGKHILMWDFDGVENLEDLVLDLMRIQAMYKLPDIYLIQSSEGNYQAYCFKEVDFKTALHIVSASKYVDENYLRLSAYRGYFTLRIDATETRPAPKLIGVIQSRYKPDLSYKDLCSFVIYEQAVKNSGGVLKRCLEAVSRSLKRLRRLTRG